MAHAEERLKFLNIKTFEQLYVYVGLIYMFKVVHGYIPSSPFFPTFANTITRGHSRKLYNPFIKTEMRKNFFHCRLLSLWNSLPESVVSSRSISKFKYFLRSSSLSLTL